MKVLNYRADLDGIRGLAVLLVVLFHAWPETFKGGFVGVDVFFVLSGFLITSLIYGDVVKGSFRLRNFWFRRIRRLGPSLLVVISATAVVGWFLLLPDEYKQLGTHIAAGSVFASNFLLISEAGYFDTSSSLKPLLHLWSLGVEEQFYVLFPLLLLGAFKFKKMAFPSIIVFCLISFTFNIYFSRNDQIFDFYSPITRFWELLAGAIVAIALSRFEPNKSYIALSIRRLNTSVVPGYLGLALLILSLFVVSDSRSYPGLQGLLPVSATIFILISNKQSGLNRKIFSFKPLVWLGLISYPLYLWHWPLFSFCKNCFWRRTECTSQTIYHCFSCCSLVFNFQVCRKSN